MKLKRIILIPLLLLGLLPSVYADGTKDDVETDYKYQVAIDFKIKLAKGLNLNIEPELRFYEGYDKFHLNGGLTYKTFGCIYWGAAYRLVVDRVESSSAYNSFGSFGSAYDSEIYHRYAFDVTYKDKFGDFTPSFRVRYNNFTDEDIDNKEYLRSRAKVAYDIPKCKITPFVAAEAFYRIEDSSLYKMRYTTGFSLKVNKKSSFSAEYKFDMFRYKYKNIHTFGLGYKCKF